MSADMLLLYGLPLLVFACLVLGIRWRSASPAWLPVTGSAALLLFAASLAVLFGPPAAGEALLYVLLPVAWCIAAAAVLLLAAVAVRRGWPARGALVVTGLAVPIPLLVFLVSAFVAGST